MPSFDEAYQAFTQSCIRLYYAADQGDTSTAARRLQQARLAEAEWLETWRSAVTGSAEGLVVQEWSA